MEIPRSSRQSLLTDGPLNLIIDNLHYGERPQRVELMMFNILNDYLQPNSKLSDNEAAQCLDAIMPENRPTQPNEEKELAKGWMLQLSNLIWEIAKQIPCTHESQGKLIQLLHAVSRLRITQTIENDRGEQLPAWHEFDLCQGGMWRALNYPQGREKPNQQICDHYVNASAFAARVHRAALKSPAYTPAFVAIETAIDWTIPGDERLPCHSIAGAQWIVLAAECL